MSLDNIINISVIIPTYNRAEVLKNTLISISRQKTQPEEIIIIDGSSVLKQITRDAYPNLISNLIHEKANELGAAKQRNQGITLAKNEIIAFFDDDILLEEGCILNLWNGMQRNELCGGINAVITNQSYHKLGLISKLFYKLLGADTNKSLAGKCIGAAVNFLPELDTKEDIVEVDWLNTGCTLYRKDALPNPVFDKHFTGYSLMEDLALSLRVSKKWKLYSASNARIFHDIQPSLERDNLLVNAEMDLVNRYYILKYILNKTSPKDNLQLLLQQLFAAVTSKKIFSLQYLRGKYAAIKKIREI